MNSFGTIFRLTSFGESHGKGVGGVIDGMPAGVEIDMDFIQKELNRRRPGQSSIVTPRKEGDKVEFLSGIFNGYSTGTPIGFVVYNENQHSSDYDNLREAYRPCRLYISAEIRIPGSSRRRSFFGKRDDCPMCRRGFGKVGIKKTFCRYQGIYLSGRTDQIA